MIRLGCIAVGSTVMSDGMGWFVMMAAAVSARAGVISMP
jgi:hypothetical protein